MKRLAWLLVTVLLLGGALTAYQTYPHHKWWMRAGYVKGWAILNTITGNDFPVPDRFK